MSQQHHLAILGLKDTGKTTYIGRLWLAVHAGSSKLKARGLPELLAPLKQVSSALLDAKYPDHTPHKRDAGQQLSFHIPLQWEEGDGEIPFSLAFADYSGEELTRIFSDRDDAWTEAWKSRASDSFGLLLFLRPQGIKIPHSPRLLEPPPSDDEHWGALAEPTEPRERKPKEKPLGPDDPSRFFDKSFLPDEKESRHAEPGAKVDPPSAVALVEVLQFLRHERGLAIGELPSPERFRIAAIVSCWDSVGEEWQKRGPSPFLQKHYPLIHDFLTTNFKPEGVQVFGLSSTGGDLNEEEFKRKYERADPEDMGELVYHPVREGSPRPTNDITLPIGWLLAGDAALPHL